jgi:hypothetical protein
MTYAQKVGLRGLLEIDDKQRKQLIESAAYIQDDRHEYMVFDYGSVFEELTGETFTAHQVIDAAPDCIVSDEDKDHGGGQLVERKLLTAVRDALQSMVETADGILSAVPVAE